jgi:D-alanyl-D-alanine carboxypeptidase
MDKKPFHNLLVSVLVAFNIMFLVEAVLADPGATLAEELQQVLDTELVKHDGKGVSAAVIIPGRKPWLGTSGISHAAVAITPDMLFGIGSNTKNFMAALILQLAEEGKLSLEDQLNQYLPDYANINNTITIRQLLNHTSGVYNITEHPSFWDTIFANRFKVWTPEALLTQFVSQPYFPPGTGWHYSNTNYTLLGMIVEAVTASQVSTELRNRFWGPLGLARTFLDIEEPIPVTEVLAHRWYDFFGDGTPDDISWLPRISEFSAYWTAGAMFSTAEDVAKWSQALFRGHVLSRASLDQMLTFHSPTPGEPQMIGYGLGTLKFAPGLVAGEEAYGHGGWVFGYSTAMAFLPDYDVSIVILLNVNNEDCLAAMANGLVEAVTDYLSRTKPMPWMPLLLLGNDAF